LAVRAHLYGDGIDYVLSVGGECDVYDPATRFAVAPRKPGSRGSALRTEEDQASIKDLIAGLGETAWQTVCFRDADGQQLASRFVFERVIAAHPVDRDRDREAPREEWLIAE